MIFNEYADYYDLLYKDKDYYGEAKYIDSIIKKYGNNVKTILELGCGTGKHAEILSKSGYVIHGIDLSEAMLLKANMRAVHNSNLRFSKANVQRFDFGEKYDAVMAWFHVISYQNSDDELLMVMKNAYNHLRSGGIFAFDSWYGPAVLLQKPELRVKRLENDRIKITRIAEPKLRENENIVEVNYDVFVKSKDTNDIKEIKEVHKMRYLFKNEVQRLVEKVGFEYMDEFEFISNLPLSQNTWGSCFVVKK